MRWLTLYMRVTQRRRPDTTGAGRLPGCFQTNAAGYEIERRHELQPLIPREEFDMAESLQELRQRAHEAGIRGNSKMDEQQLREALERVEKGEDPIEAKREARGWTES